MLAIFVREKYKYLNELPIHFNHNKINFEVIQKYFHFTSAVNEMSSFVYIL